MMGRIPYAPRIIWKESTQMKRILAITLIFLMLLPLASCASRQEPVLAEPKPTAAPTITPTPSPTIAPAIAPEVSETDDENVRHILVNQLGYRLADTKIAFIRGSAVGAKFMVVNADNEVKYEGSINESIFDPAADETVYHGDFSKFREEGEYRVVVEGIGQSDRFVIADEPYTALLGDALNYFTTARCGVECLCVESKWTHEACHTYMATGSEENIILDVSGGWHAAADYSRCVIPAAKAVTDIMLAYKNGASKDGALLDDIAYELTWLMKMQRSDGAVYHKVTSEKAIYDIMPDADDQELILCPPSTCATADFAAVTALGYTIYKDVDAEFANALLQAARAAYTYNLTCDFESFKNPDGVKTDEYTDISDQDERLFAAVALYMATGEKRYHDEAKALLFAGEIAFDGFGYSDMSGYAHLLYLSLDDGLRDAAVAEAVEKGVLAAADKRMAAIDASGYNVALGMEYKRNSNMYVLSDAALLLLAGDITGSAAYGQNAKYQLDYILGVNALGVCFVTGYGKTYPKTPHHALSIASGQTQKGMLVSGPDSNLEDSAARAELEGCPAAKCYSQSQDSASTNGVAIYLNSALIYVLSAIA